MRTALRALTVFATVFLCACATAAQGVPTPSGHLGRELAADFTLADWGEVTSYYEKLAAATKRVKLERVGKTTEGRDFLLAVISGEKNMARLDEIRRHAARLADPRGASADELEQAEAMCQRRA